MDERRSFPRVTLALPLQHETHSGWQPLGETFDLSEGGLGVKLATSLPEISSIRWRTLDKQIEALGRIAWFDEAHNRCGIQFLEIDPDSKTNLLKNLILNPTYLQSKIATLTKQVPSTYSYFLDLVLQNLRSANDLLLMPSLGTEEIKQTLFRLFDVLYEQADEHYATQCSKSALPLFRKLLREFVGPWLYQSSIIKHAFQKPRGYPGDYITMETIYNNTPISSGPGRIFDFYFLDNPYAVAVRNRKEKMKEILSLEILNSQRDLKILNVACGSCREIKELIPQICHLKNKISFSLVDHDEEALVFAKNSFQEEAISKNIFFNFIKEDVFNLIQNPTKYVQKLSESDIIYSLGLIDYLPDRVLKSFVRFLLQLLPDKGTLILTHKDAQRYNPRGIHWYCDWHFYHRTQPQLLTLINEAAPTPVQIRVEREKSQIIFFLLIHKLLAVSKT